MRWEFLVSWRYLVAGRKEKFISVTTILSVASVTIGVAALIIVLAVMNGFGDKLRQKIVGFNYHVHIQRSGGIKDAAPVLNRLAAIDEIAEATPFIDGQAIVMAERREPRGVMIRGLDASREKGFIDIKLVDGPFELTGKEVSVGNELAALLRVSVGSRLTLISGSNAAPASFRVASIFHSGMYDYDANVIFTSLEAAKVLFKTGDAVGGIGVRLKRLDAAKRVKEALLAIFGRDYIISTWSELNKNLFAAIRLEKILVFIVVTLTIGVGALNIINTLSLLTMEKTKDIGILKALGATKLNIANIYILKGLYIGLIGSSLGFLVGISVTKNINEIADVISRLTGFELFSSQIYYLDKIPVSVNYADIWLIMFFAVGLSFLAALYPAWHASRLDPIETLRYE